MPAQGPVPGTPRLLRAINDRAALQLLLQHGRLSRSEIGTLTGLSKPTASQLLTRLESAGLLLSVGVSMRDSGRTAELYEVNPQAGHAVAFDVTPSRTLASLVDLGGGVVTRLETKRPRGQVDAPAHLAPILHELTTRADLLPDRVTHCVIGLSGAYDETVDGLRHAKHLAGWHVPRLHERLTDALGLDVLIENDVNLVAIAEHERGAATGTQTSVLLWSSSGVGAALIVGGRLHRGSTGSAGEVGFLPVPGQPLIRHAARDNTGGFQRAVGGAGILELGRGLGLRGAGPVQMVRAAVASGASAEAFLGELATRYAAGLAATIAVLDPQLVVLAGPVLQAGGEDLRARIESEIASLAMSAVPVALGQVSDDPVLTGAQHAALWRLRDALFTTSGTTAAADWSTPASR